MVQHRVYNNSQAQHGAYNDHQAHTYLNLARSQAHS